MSPLDPDLDLEVGMFLDVAAIVDNESVQIESKGCNEISKTEP